MEEYDAIIVGLGAVGVATTYELSQTDMDILGIDKYTTPNERGSSHGESRIFRFAYHEGEKYVPLLQKAAEKWQRLEEKVEKPIFHKTGSLMIGRENADKFKSSKETCDTSNLEYTLLDNSTLQERFPAWDIPDELVALYQPEGGLLDVKNCLSSQLQQAIENNATIQEQTEVTDWEPFSDGRVRLKTDSGTYVTNHLVIASGPWASSITGIEKYLNIERHAYCNLEMEVTQNFDKENFPVWVFDSGTGRRFYGLPQYNGNNIKLGDTVAGTIIDTMNDFERQAETEEAKSSRKFAEDFFSSKVTALESVSACPLTHTPDGHFIIDTLPNHQNIYLGVGLSGHGFKLSNVIGEMLCELVTDGETDYDRSLFELDRFE